MTTTDHEQIAVKVLTEKVYHLEHRNSELKNELDKARSASLEAMLGPLRLREAVLVHFGTAPIEQFAEKLAVEFGSDIAHQALRHMFDLNNASIEDNVREAFRTWCIGKNNGSPSGKVKNPTVAELYLGFDLNCPAIKAPIEPGVKPVCDALNSIAGVHTLWSCEGHPELPARPYVTFIAPQETALRLSRLLGHGHGDGTLKYCWRLTANFRDDGSLQYTIKQADRRINGDAFRWWWSRQWDKRVMKEELANFANLLMQISQQ